jgi:dodecin
MDQSVYRVTELIGVSSESWEAAARNAIETAATTLRDLRIAEAHRFDVTIEDGKVKTYRVRLDVSFKYGSDVTAPEGDQAEEWEHTRHELQ